jgi:hypothetical protein
LSALSIYTDAPETTEQAGILVYPWKPLPSLDLIPLKFDPLAISERTGPARFRTRDSNERITVFHVITLFTVPNSEAAFVRPRAV